MNLISWYFLFMIGVVVPFLAFRSARRTENTVAVSRTRIYVSTLFLMSAVFALALMTAQHSGIKLFPPFTLTLRLVLIGVASLTFKLGYFWWSLRKRGVSDRPALKFLVPQTGGEKILYTLLAICAGIMEETNYRGVAFQLFSRIFQNTSLGALASAIIFGLAHKLQGWRVMIVVMLHGLIDQYVVHLTGSLYIAMAVHMTYDFLAGIIVSSRLQTVAQPVTAA